MLQHFFFFFFNYQFATIHKMDYLYYVECVRADVEQLLLLEQASCTSPAQCVRGESGVHAFLTLKWDFSPKT